MMDKDSEHLLETLSRVCLEHRSMAAILKDGGGNWVNDVKNFASAPKVKSEVRELLRPLYEQLQSTECDASLIQGLTTVLNQNVTLNSIRAIDLISDYEPQ
jgi:hypothetical protein